MMLNNKRKLLFVTGTRADFGKLKPLMQAVQKTDAFALDVFVTGMHMLKQYGSTYLEVVKTGFPNIHTYINQFAGSPMDIVLSNTIHGLAQYVHESEPDAIIIHGDRVEALASAIVGSMRNILVAHVEGGEVSGTIDESIRHCVSKMSHIHFVANNDAKRRLSQMGESKESIHVIGSPDVDIMKSSSLPSLEEVKKQYHIPFNQYGIALFHPVTTEIEHLHLHAKEYIDALIESDEQFIVVYPNNDEGSQKIISEFKRLKGNQNFCIFPSIRFERFLTLLKNSKFMVGNSSSGIREAPYYNIPVINIGTRQNGRHENNQIINCDYRKENILQAILDTKIELPYQSATFSHFGEGRSAELFLEIILSEQFWNTSAQKKFHDI